MILTAASAAAASYQFPVWVDKAVVIATWVSAMLFAILYTLKAPWWQTWMGRNLFALDMSVAGALTPAMLAYFFNVNPDGAIFSWFEVADLAAVTLTVVHRGYLLWKVQPGWNWHPLRAVLKLRRGGHDDDAGPAVRGDTPGS